MLLRGLRRRCPLCGAGGLFRSWIEPHGACPRCGLRLDRGEPDFFLGAYAINFVTAELILAAFLALVVAATWPAPPWDLLFRGGLVLVVLAPILFFPFSRTLWLALELIVRPPEPSDFEPASADDA